MDKIEQTQNQKKERNWWSIPHPLRNWYLGGEFIAEREKKQQAGSGEDRDRPSRDVGK